jgi:hypothetical protein
MRKNGVIDQGESLIEASRNDFAQTKAARSATSASSRHLRGRGHRQPLGELARHSFLAGVAGSQTFV